MKNWIAFFLCFAVLFGCSEGDSTIDEEHIISTEEGGATPESPEELIKLFGQWSQIGEGCDENGKNCIENPNKTWTFRKGTLNLDAFTHPYYVRRDSLFIAGRPYLILSLSDDKMMLNNISNNSILSFKKLKKNN